MEVDYESQLRFTGMDHTLLSPTEIALNDMRWLLVDKVLKGELHKDIAYKAYEAFKQYVAENPLN